MTGRDKPLDRINVERRGPDFLSRVREVCRLRTDQDRSTFGAEIIERNRGKLGEAAASPATAADQIMASLGTDGPRFILMLGDFGTGKTFLLHAPAEWLAQQNSRLVPVLVTADGTVRLWTPATGTLLTTMVASADGWAVLLPGGSYKLHGQPAGLWWAIGLCRFDLADLPDITPYQPQLRQLPREASLY